uniref:NADH-ubiquinone oxidoreductase chain 4L n=1 Tax=Trichochrysea japana TaxID=3073295 RepID=A0AA51NPU0_9CUCU|nr:NADH dehydrogenase subunit 4L [Trichochrysea japana]WMQ75986.1 NADH dehydrogenase subunit 4L [Trichochrysea japana]
MLMIFVLMYFSGLISFLLKYNHLLMLLLSLEFIVLSLYYGLFIYLSLVGYEYFFMMLFLIFSVAEGVLGLGILVMMIRSHGNDYLSTFSFLW